MTTQLLSLLSPRRVSVAFAAFCSLASRLAVLAQTPSTGSIQGRVYNPASREFVNNAEVRLKGTNQVTYTKP